MGGGQKMPINNPELARLVKLQTELFEKGASSKDKENVLKDIQKIQHKLMSKKSGD